jgi:hypothetical protein
MKAIDCRMEKLVECYQKSTEDSERADVMKLAKEVLNHRCYSMFLDICIHYEYQNVALCEVTLGLSGVQNEDNL